MSKIELKNIGIKHLHDPLVVNVDGKEKFVFVHRTNNLVDNHFRKLTYGYRRIHGNRSVRRNLENIPEQLPLTENLKNSNYVKLVFEDESKIAKRFSKVDVCEIRKMLTKQHSRKQLLGTRKTKRFIRQPEFKDQSDQHFLLLLVKKYGNPTKFCDYGRIFTNLRP